VTEGKHLWKPSVVSAFTSGPDLGQGRSYYPFLVGDPQQIVWAAPVRPFFESALLEAPPEGIEPPTQALGRPRSIR
jgi:hypothetical protein